MIRAAGLYSVFTSNEGSSRKRWPSQGMSSPAVLPSSRVAGQEKQLTRVRTVTRLIAWSMWPRCSSEILIVNAPRGSPVAVAPSGLAKIPGFLE